MPTYGATDGSCGLSFTVSLTATLIAGATMSYMRCTNCRVLTPWALAMNTVATFSSGLSRSSLRNPGHEPPWPTKVLLSLRQTA